MPQFLADRRIVAAILLAAAVRLGLATAVWAMPGPMALHDPDTNSYILPAQELWRHGAFAVQGRPEIVRTPGYPCLLALGVAVGRLEPMAVGLQIGLASLTTLLTGLLAALLIGPVEPPPTAGRPHTGPKELIPTSAALAASLLLALEPLSVLYSVKLTSETLFTATHTLSLVLLANYLRRPRLTPLLLASAALSAAVYVRPIAYFLPLVGAAAILLAHGKAQAAKGVRHAAILAVFCGSLVGLWQVRNWHSAGFVRFSAIGDVTRYYYTAAAIWAKQHGESYYDVQDRWGYHNQELHLAQHPEQRLWSDAQRLAWMRGRSAELICRYPLIAARLHVRGMGLMLTEPSSVEWLRIFGRYPREGRLLGRMFDDGVAATLSDLRREQPLVFWNCAAGVLLLATLYALAVAGWLRLPNTRDPVLALVLLQVTYFLIASGGPQAVGRFRHPIMPHVCALAGIGLAAIIVQSRRASSRIRP